MKQKFDIITSTCVPLPLENVDTDQIIPVKDIEDIEGDREMECRTIPIVWGVKTAKMVVTILLIAIAAFVAYLAFTALPFPYTWQSFSTRYVVFGMITPILCAVALLWAAKTPLEYRRNF